MRVDLNLSSVCFFSRLNGSLPNNVEIKNNTLFFKGPVTYELGGTYVCDATNSIGTRSGLVEVNVTGKSRGGRSAEILVLMWGMGDRSSRNVRQKNIYFYSFMREMMTKIFEQFLFGKHVHS